MLLKTTTLLSSILQIFAAAFLSVGTFETSERVFQVFIQPAGWAFAVWGLIYTLSLIYGVYQIIPKSDNETLRATRLPATIGFLGSIAWLYFAGMDNWMIWLTIPVLFIMAASFVFVINAPVTGNKKQIRLSRNILLPYAAWTGIASWLNIQALLSEQSVILDNVSNLMTNGILFACITIFTLYYFKETKYNPWYGGVMIWAGIGVMAANLNGGNIIFAILGGLLSVVVAGLLMRGKFKT